MRYVISVGANVNDPAASVVQALMAIPHRLDSLNYRASGLYGTSPVGGPDQPDFVNAVIVVDSRLHPAQVLDRLQALELEAGRVRDVRWGPRTLDLDIIDADGLVSDDPDLTLPHPRAHERGFVLIPWAEVDATASLPGYGEVVDLVGCLDPQQRVQLLPVEYEDGAR